MSPPTRPVPVVLDVDTGVDDALALLYAVASPGIDLRAVTCVGGNTGLATVVANTTAVLAAAGARDVPVFAGRAHPRTGDAGPAEAWHGEDGLLGCRPAPGAPPRPEHAVDAVAALVRASAEPVTLVPLGPQTTVADLLTGHPDVARALAAVHFMGGSGVGGNVTASAEFNVHHDPEAAAEVLACGAPVRMYGLEVFEHVRVAPADVERLLAARHPAPRLAGELCRASAARSGTSDACLGDAGAVAVLDRPDLARSVLRDVAVQLGEGPARGATVVDRRVGGRERMPDGHPVEVYEHVDGTTLAAHFVSTVLSTWR